MTKALRKNKLKNFRSSLFDNISKIALSKLPVALERLSLYRKDSRVCSLCANNYQDYQTALTHLVNLKTFELLIPTEPTIIASLLNSLPQATNITTLGLDINNTPEGSYLQELELALKLFTELTKLSVKFNNTLDDFNLLEVFQNCPLEHLELLLPIQQENLILNLGYLLGKFQRIKLLRIKLVGLVIDSIPEAFTVFFEQISHLSQIRTIDINILIDYSSYSSEEASKVIFTGFSECLDKLPNLREISFNYAEGNFVPEFGSLANALRRKARNLKKLEISLPVHKQPKLEDMRYFMKALKDMHSLETLMVNNFVCENVRFTEKFTQVLASLPQISTIKFNNVNVKMNRKNIIEQLEIVMRKKGIETVHCRGVIQMTGKTKNNPSIDLANIIKANSRLKVVYLPYSLSMYIKNMGLVNGNKWK